MAKTQTSQRFGWTSGQLIHLSRSLAAGCGDYRQGQGTPSRDRSAWTVQQRLQLSAAKASLFI